MPTQTVTMVAGAQPEGGTGRGYDQTGAFFGTPIGSVDPQTVSSLNIGAIEASGVPDLVTDFALAFTGGAQDFFESVSFTDKDSVLRTLNSADADYTEDGTGGFNTWIWDTTSSFNSTLFTDGDTYILTFMTAPAPAVLLDSATVVGATDVLLVWEPSGVTSPLTVQSYDVIRNGVDLVTGLDPTTLSYADSTELTKTEFTYQIRMHLSDGSSVLSNTETVTTGDVSAEFNCDCEVVSSYATLAELRVRMAIQCGYAAQAANLPPGQVTEFNEYLFSSQRQLYYKFRAQRTERFFSWTMTPGLRYYGLDAAEGACTLQLDPLGITWVGFEDLNLAWYRLIEGIDPVYYTRANINFGWPTRYEIRSCIEIFPAPQAAYTLWIKGDIGLAPFASDSDRTTFDDEAVLLYATANWKSAKGKQDAERAMNQATARLNDLTARKHGTARYVPSTYVQNPATPPRFLPLGSQQS